MLALAAVAVPSPLIVQRAEAVTIGIYNGSDPTQAIFGSGNGDGSWTSATAASGASVALRFHDRNTGAMPTDNAGTYTFSNGSDVNLDFSALAGTGSFLSSYRYRLLIDVNPAAGIIWASFDPVYALPDNSWGNSGTANGAGVEGLASAYAASSTLVQNSERDIWFGFHPFAAGGVYDMAFVAYAADDILGRVPLAATEARLVIQPERTSSVPDAGGTLGLMALALGGMVVRKKKMRR